MNVEQQTIKSEGWGLNSRQDRRHFSLPYAISHFFTSANAQ